MDEINRRLNVIFDKNKFTIINNKRKNGLVSLKEGYITYQIQIKSFGCHCGNNDNNNICDHILFILYEYFKLDTFVISYLTFENIKQQFIEYINLNVNYNKINDLLHNDIVNFLDESDCGICLLKLSNIKYNYQVYKCDVCKNCVHSYCMTQWLQNNKSKKCIYCSSKIII